MPTTALLVEIVIVGFIFFLSALPLVTLGFNIEPQLILKFYNDIPLLYQLAAAYVIGVLWNRVCDLIFSKFDERIIQHKFKSKESYHEARIEVVVKGESIRDYIGNFRSLIRIARASSVLFLIYVIMTPIYLFILKTPFNLVTVNKVVVIVVELLSLLGSGYAWFRLERGYVAAVYDAHTAIKREMHVDSIGRKGHING